MAAVISWIFSLHFCSMVMRHLFLFMAMTQMRNNQTVKCIKKHTRPVGLNQAYTNDASNIREKNGYVQCAHLTATTPNNRKSCCCTCKLVIRPSGIMKEELENKKESLCKNQMKICLHPWCIPMGMPERMNTFYHQELYKDRCLRYYEKCNMCVCAGCPSEYMNWRRGWTGKSSSGGYRKTFFMFSNVCLWLAQVAGRKYLWLCRKRSI